MKKEYTKPAMMVYCLKAQPQLLAGSPTQQLPKDDLEQQLPKDDLETIEQW